MMLWIFITDNFCGVPNFSQTIKKNIRNNVNFKNFESSKIKLR